MMKQKECNKEKKSAMEKQYVYSIKHKPHEYSHNITLASC
jgi:hypothetical protein